MIEELLAHPEHLKLGGERRELSIFFPIFKGLHQISEKLNPEKLTALLNEYLSAMTDIIHEESGTIDKYEGTPLLPSGTLLKCPGSRDPCRAGCVALPGQTG